MGKKKKSKNSNYKQVEPKAPNKQTEAFNQGLVKYKPGRIATNLINVKAVQKMNEIQRLQYNSMRLLCTEFPGLTCENIRDAHNTLLRAYNNALIQRGLRLSEKALFEQDTIDISNLSVPNEIPGELPSEVVPDLLRTIPEDQRFYASIPCLEQGILYQASANCTLRFKLLELKPKEKYAQIKLYDYENNAHLDDTSAKDVMCAAEAICEILPDGTYNMLEFVGKKDILQKIPISQLGWTKLDQTFMEKYIRQSEIDLYTIKALKEGPEAESKPMMELMYAFQNAILMTNKILEEHSKTQSTKTAAGHKHTNSLPNPTRTYHQDQDPPDRLVRHYGNLKIISKATPHRATQATVRNYKVASWTVRGHLRHYKDGRTVYIRPTTAKRKINNIEDQKKTPVHLKFEGESTCSSST